MIATILVLSLVALILATAWAIANAKVEVAGTSTWPFGTFFVGQSMSPRPRGVQEEDLPRFVFRDRVASPATGTWGAKRPWRFT